EGGRAARGARHERAAVAVEAEAERPSARAGEVLEPASIGIEADDAAVTQAGVDPPVRPDRDVLGPLAPHVQRIGPAQDAVGLEWAAEGRTARRGPPPRRGRDPPPPGG